MTYAIAAAGTGGHVLPALAVADALVTRGVPSDEILFLGGNRFEAEAVPARGYPFRGFELIGLQRSLSVRNLRIPGIVRRTAWDMAAVLTEAGTRVVIGMSGYVTVPAAMAARRARAILLVHEQNASPTLSVRFGARRAQAVLLGLPGPAERLRRSVIVGNPLRPEIAGFDRGALRSAARARYGLPADGPVIGILGGSLGAQVLNEAAGSLADLGVAMLHLTGRAAGGVANPTDRASLPWIRVPFETEMQDFYAAVDLVVSRAGAMTVSELAATGTPAVLVPLERVRQDANAEVLRRAGGAVVVRQRHLERLPTTVSELLADPAHRRSMGAAGSAIATSDAAGAVAAHLMEASRG